MSTTQRLYFYNLYNVTLWTCMWQRGGQSYLYVIERKSVLLLLTIFLIFAKLVVYLASSTFLQLINNFFLSLTEYLTVIGVTLKSFGRHQGFAKIHTFGRFPVTITTPAAFFTNYHRLPSPRKNLRTFLDSLTHSLHFTSLTSLHSLHSRPAGKGSTRTERLMHWRLVWPSFFYTAFAMRVRARALRALAKHQKEHPAPQEMKFRHKKQKIVLPMVILEFGYPSPQLHQTLKPIRDLFCTTVPIYHVMCIPKL